MSLTQKTPAPTLFTPVTLGSLTLANRMVMAPMTRSRAAAGQVVTELTATYYAQRASAGLIISEGTQVMPQGIGYIDTPGIHDAAQVAAWRRVTDAVHAAGGRIFAQLWHVGRVSHPDFQGGSLPVAPSAIGFDGMTYTHNGPQKTVVPRALDRAEIPGIVDAYARAARNARAAGFDGVEIHGANGYLPDQFLQDIANQRTDEYGGSAENRARFLLEVTKAAIDAWNADRVGVRLSPLSTFNGMGDSDPGETFGTAIRLLSPLGLSYLHLVGDADGRFAAQFDGAVIANGGLTYAAATGLLAEGKADLASFGTPFLANPDLPERFKRGAPLNEADRSKFYGGGAAGYTDYPALAAV
jgi:N-ethylmaleimide reductase